MTKAERMAILQWSEKISDEKERCDAYFSEHQKLAKEVGVPVCCNPLANRDQLQSTQFATRADILYDQYIQASAKHDAMKDLLSKLCEVATDPLRDGKSGWIVRMGP